MENGVICNFCDKEFNAEDDTIKGDKELFKCPKCYKLGKTKQVI